MIDFLLTFNSNPRLSYLPIKVHVLNKLQVCHVLSNRIFLDFFDLPLPILITTSQPLTPPQQSICVSSLHMPKQSQFLLPHLVHYGSHSHFIPDNFVPNPISLHISTHSSQHHFSYSNLLDMRVFTSQHSVSTSFQLLSYKSFSLY